MNSEARTFKKSCIHRVKNVQGYLYSPMFERRIKCSTYKLRSKLKQTITEEQCYIIFQD